MILFAMKQTKTQEKTNKQQKDIIWELITQERKIKDKITEDSALNQNTQRTTDLSKSIASNETSKKIKQIKGTRK